MKYKINLFLKMDSLFCLSNNQLFFFFFFCQMELINCFQFGLVSKCPQLCMNALRMCALEMPDAMTRFLPEIILSLSKISSTVYVGIPVLSFLSSKCSKCFLFCLQNIFQTFSTDTEIGLILVKLLT